MARSYKRSTASGITTARSEKKDKQRWHRVWRAQERRRWKEAWRRGEEETYQGVGHREVSNRWRMAKDGRQWWGTWRRWCPTSDYKARKAWTTKMWRK